MQPFCTFNSFTCIEIRLAWQQYIIQPSYIPWIVSLDNPDDLQAQLV